MPSKTSKSSKQSKKPTQTASTVSTARYANEPELSVRLNETGIKHPWPEWSDKELNSTKWPALPKDGKVSKKGEKKGKDSKTSKESKTSSEKSKNKASAASEASKNIPSEPTVAYFTDKEQLELPIPLSQKIDSWKRPLEQFDKKELVLYLDSAPEYSDLLSGNKSLLESELIRHITSSITLLQHLSIVDKFPIEMVSGDYIPNTSGVAWKPWHHVYAMCKSENKKSHKPELNPEGMYYVRLYHLGRWRKIIVDDSLPIDDNNIVLLPLSVIPKSGQIELWPALLTKALIKVANLSNNSTSELTDFNAIHSLTGWCVDEYQIDNNDEEIMWDFIIQHSDRYTWPDDKNLAVPKGKGSKKAPKTKVSKKASKTSEESKSKNGSSKTGKTSEILPKYIILELRDPAEENKSGSYEKLVYVRQSRDIPLEKPPQETELTEWKYYRWIPWAIRHELYTVTDDSSIKSLQIVLVDHVLEFIAKATATVDTPGPKPPQHKPSPKQKVNRNEPPPDLNVWVDFTRLSNFIEKIIIFHRPSQFKSNIRISDTPFSHAKGVTAKSASNKAVNIIWPSLMAKSRNYPIYLFMDSLEVKKLVVSFSNLNYSAFKDIVLEAFDININAGVDEKSKEEKSDAPIKGHLFVEEYEWKSMKNNAPYEIVSTYGLKTKNLMLNKGRCVLRLWIKSDTTYNIHLLSETSIEVGSFEKISELMSCESLTILTLTKEISDAFHALVSSFGTNKYKESLRVFYDSYKPDKPPFDMENRKMLKITLHYQFNNNLIKFIEAFTPIKSDLSDMVFALQVLLMEPNLGVEKPNIDEEPASSIVVTSSSFIFGTCDMFNIAASVIQAAFKSLHVKYLRSCHSPKHKRYPSIAKTLMKIYDKFMSPSQREHKIPRMIRSFLNYNELLQSVYSATSDFKCTFNSVVYKGVVPEVQPNKWVAITRLVLFTHAKVPCIYKIDLFCALPLYVVRVFNNDTNEEVPCLNNNVIVHEYIQNLNGYTVLCYGWNDEGNFKDLPWKLKIFSENNDPLLHMCDNRSPKCELITVPNIVSTKTTNYYLPNINNKLFKCLIKIKQNSLVTLSLKSTYENAVICIKCISPNGTTIGEVIGKGNVMYPVLLLELTRESDTDLSKHSATSNSQEIGSILGKNSATSKSEGIGSMLSKKSITSKSQENGSLLNKNIEIGSTFSKTRVTSKSGSLLNKNNATSKSHERGSILSKRSVTSKSGSLLNKKNASSKSQEIGSILSLKSSGDSAVIDFTQIDFRPKHLRKRLKSTPKSWRRNSKKTSGSISMASSVESKLESQNGSIFDKVYAIEAIVMPDTWPLYPQEWAVTEAEMQKKNYGVVMKPPSNDSLRSKTSRKSSVSKRNSTSVASMDVVLDNPNWVLDMMVDNADNVTISQDKSREKEIFEMKRQWEEMEPGRLKRGEKVRQNFYNCVSNNAKYFLPPVNSKGSFEIFDISSTESNTLLMNEELRKQLMIKLSVQSKDINWETWNAMMEELLNIQSESKISEFSSNKLLPKEPERTLISPIKQDILNRVAGLNLLDYPPEDTMKPSVLTPEMAESLKEERSAALAEFAIQQDELLQENTDMTIQRCLRIRKMDNYYDSLVLKCGETLTTCYTQRTEHLTALKAAAKEVIPETDEK